MHAIFPPSQRNLFDKENISNTLIALRLVFHDSFWWDLVFFGVNMLWDMAFNDSVS